MIQVMREDQGGRGLGERVSNADADDILHSIFSNNMSLPLQVSIH